MSAQEGLSGGGSGLDPLRLRLRFFLPSLELNGSVYNNNIFPYFKSLNLNTDYINYLTSRLIILSSFENYVHLTNTKTTNISMVKEKKQQKEKK